MITAMGWLSIGLFGGWLTVILYARFKDWLFWRDKQRIAEKYRGQHP